MKRIFVFSLASVALLVSLRYQGVALPRFVVGYGLADHFL